MADEDVMAVDATCSPRTLPRNASSEPTNPRRDSTEDANPTLTRKRPRLNSQARRSRSLSLDPATVATTDVMARVVGDTQEPASSATTIADPNIPSSPPTGGQSIALCEPPCTPTSSSPPSPKTAGDLQPHPQLTPSKVTINVRARRSRSRSPDKISSGESVSHLTASPACEGHAAVNGVWENSSTPADLHSPNDDPITDPADHVQPAPAPQSPSTVSARSPEVEAAELEDMNPDDGVNGWDPLISTVESEDSGSLVERFPLYNSEADMREIVQHLAAVMEKGPLDSHLIVEVAQWFADCADRIERQHLSWHEISSDHPDFWIELPNVPENFLKRRITFADDLTAGDDEANPIDTFFVQFTRLSLQLIDVDIDALQQNTLNTSTEPDLLSLRCQMIVSWVLLGSRSSDFPLWRLLHNHYAYDVDALAVTVALAFAPAWERMALLTELIARRILQCPRLWKMAWYPIWIAQRVVDLTVEHGPTLASQLDVASQPLRDLWQNAPRHAANVCRAVDQLLQVAVTKEAGLPRDRIKDMSHNLANLLHQIAQIDPELGQVLFREREPDRALPAVDDLPSLVSRAWRFYMLRRCILSGRMEVRVQALDSMCAELIDAFKQYGVARYDHPVMQYLADFILNTRLVEYLVGVDSHLQLVERAANVAGFLIVTKKYTPHESDVIWNMVRTHQDPRVVGAILRMLKGFFSVASYPILLYLCQKLDELPVQSFDAAMIEYAASLLVNLREKFHAVPQTRLDIPPYHFCIRLIRECTSPTTSSTVTVTALAQFAFRELQELLMWGPSIDDRKAIYLQCIQDITSKTASSTGSICVINGLLAQMRVFRDVTEDLDTLALDLDLTRLLIEETSYLLKHDALRLLPTDEAVLNPRLDLLERIIGRVPETITPPLSEQLWKNLAENKTLGVVQRDLWWEMLCKVTGRLRSRNPFIDHCADILLSRLHPAYFTPGLLNWVQQVIQYKNRLIPTTIPDGNEIIEIVGSDMLWRIILTAPDQTIEKQTVDCLVGFLVDPSLIYAAPPSAVEATHLALVERCVAQLTQAAARLKSFGDGVLSGEDESMIIVARDTEVEAEELRFRRSLSFLKEFFRAVRERPRPALGSHGPVVAPPTSPIVSGDRGEPIKIRYQSFPTDPTHPGTKELEMDSLDTCQSLRDRLCRATGFTSFRTISSGHEIDLGVQPSRQISELQLGPQPLLISQRPQPATPPANEVSHEGLSGVEIELLKHFDHLYDLLGLEDHLASQLWDFLNGFPLHSRPRKFCDSDISFEVMFPIGQPFKVMYSASTMEGVLEVQVAQELSEEGFIMRGLELLVTALTNDALLESVADEALKIRTLSTLVHCLLQYLKVIGPTSATLGDELVLVDRFLLFFEQSISPSCWNMQESIALSSDSLSCILLASQYKSSFWEIFKDREKVPALIRRLVLEDPRPQLRDAICGIISRLGRDQKRLTEAVVRDITLFYWHILSSTLATIPKDQELQSLQLLEATRSLLHVMGDSYGDDIDMARLIAQWVGLLMGHEHHEVVGKESIDHFLYGITRLLHQGIEVAQRLKQPIPARELVETFFAGLLFPDLSSWTTGERIVERAPILHSPTRKAINDIILQLCQDAKTYHITLTLLADLVPNPYVYSLTWNFQRAKSIRSPTGYVGLSNLSNTCYLNSLFTQLFMNVSFRRFILDANVPDGDGSQKLLSETQKLFSHMQNSWQVAVEPRELAGSIKDYENKHIDVTLQMDVDEFYNLLFDRWEGQILSDEDKKLFRSFYGGQLVQQVRSRECEHISEREEPFSAIQCDIKGKPTLQESLQAYVEGDMMEGDNKYSCTSCGRHVDAVKRTCLKEVPDNLIFHLKRFDFDLRTMQRSKINDYFQFPSTIDMSPYKIEHLSDPQQKVAPDIFELVGVLVHSGTAESGHYYSFIRERPAANPMLNPQWVQYNDSDVQGWDPSNMEGQCYGGMETWSQTRDVQPLVLPKSYSAYMLFYQRSSTIQPDSNREDHMTKADGSTTSKPPVTLELANHIALENELFLRKYCLYDENHTLFVKSAFNLLRQSTKGVCSEDHEMERTAINMVLNYVDQVVARVKDVPDFELLLDTIMEKVKTCAICCKFLVEWTAEYSEVTRNLLLRSPTPKVRHEYGSLIIRALRCIRQNDPCLYGMDTSEDGTESWIQRFTPFGGVLNVLNGFWDVMDMHLRAWDEYFWLLVQMMALGGPERASILRYGYLRRTLEIFVADYDNALRAGYDRLLRAIAKGKKAPFKQLSEFVKELLGALDLTNRSLATSEEDRYRNDSLDSYPLTRGEEGLVKLHLVRHKTLIFLARMVEINHNTEAVAQIVAHMTRSEPRAGMLTFISHTLIRGISFEPSSQAGTWLQAALAYCQHAPSPVDVKDVAFRTAKEVDTIGSNGGREHLLFYRSLSAMTNERWPPQHNQYFRQRVLEYVHLWAPPLLLYWEPEVREGTETFLQRLLFDYGAPAETNPSTLTDMMNRAGRELGQACLNKLHERYTESNVHVERRLLESICRVLAECRPYCVENDFDFDARRDAIMSNLRDLVIEEADEPVSEEWDNDSNPVSDSSDVDVALRTGATTP